MDLAIGSVLAKATPQLGPYRPHGGGPGMPVSGLRDFLQNTISRSKRYLESNEPATRPVGKRRKGENVCRKENFVEVFADGDWYASCWHRTTKVQHPAKRFQLLMVFVCCAGGMRM
jgi:hypothetical protein